MEQLLEFEAMLYQALFMSVTHYQFKLLTVGPNTIWPEVFIHETAAPPYYTVESMLLEVTEYDYPSHSRTVSMVKNRLSGGDALDTAGDIADI